MVKVKSFCLILGVIFLLEGCSRPPYALLPATTGNAKAAGAGFKQENPHQSSLFASHSASEPVTDFHPGSLPKSQAVSFEQISSGSTRTGQIQLPGAHEDKLFELTKPFPEKQYSNGTINALKNESSPGKALSQANFKQLKKLQTGFSKPLTGKGYFIFILFGLFVLLGFLLLSNLSTLAVIGLLLGGILAALLLFFIVLTSGGFGKIGG